MNIQVVAHHEAGHAVAAFYFDHAIDRVTIQPGEDFAGLSVSTAGYGKDFAPDAAVEPTQFVKMLNDIVVFLAGYEAEAFYRGVDFNAAGATNASMHDWLEGGSGDDFVAIGNLASYLVAGQEEHDALLRWRQVATRQFVARHWSEIEAVAKALLERTTLTGDEVRMAINVALFGEERAAALMAVPRSEE